MVLADWNEKEVQAVAEDHPPRKHHQTTIIFAAKKPFPQDETLRQTCPRRISETDAIDDLENGSDLMGHRTTR